MIVLFFSTSCGASRSTIRVRNNADSTQTTISVSNGDGGSTTVHVAPQISLGAIDSL